MVRRRRVYVLLCCQEFAMVDKYWKKPRVINGWRSDVQPKRTFSFMFWSRPDDVMITAWRWAAYATRCRRTLTFPKAYYRAP